jgi:hypothetical protein
MHNPIKHYSHEPHFLQAALETMRFERQQSTEADTDNTKWYNHTVLVYNELQKVT